MGEVELGAVQRIGKDSRRVTSVEVGSAYLDRVHTVCDIESV